MGEATPPSHTVPTALDHSPMPAHDGTAHLKPSSASLLESNGKTDGGHPPITSPVTTHGDSAVDEQQVLDQVAMEPPKKRSRDETTENDDASPPLEELLVTPVDREATVEPAFSTTVGRTGATANSHEDGQSVAEPVNVEQPEETTQTMQTIEKVVPKKITVKASRARACAACKKRKVSPHNVDIILPHSHFARSNANIGFRRERLERMQANCWSQRDLKRRKSQRARQRWHQLDLYFKRTVPMSTVRLWKQISLQSPRRRKMPRPKRQSLPQKDRAHATVERLSASKGFKSSYSTQRSQPRKVSAKSSTPIT